MQCSPKVKVDVAQSVKRSVYKHEDPSSGLRAHIKSQMGWCTLVISLLRRWRQENPGSLLISHPCLIREAQANRKMYQKKNKAGWVIHEKWHRRLTFGLHRHGHTYKYEHVSKKNSCLMFTYWGIVIGK